METTRSGPLLAGTLAALTTLAGCGPEPASEPDLGTAPTEVAGEGYATSDACRACHPSEYASWEASYHRTMTRPATPENVLADFDGTEARAEGYRFRMSRQGDRFFASIPEPPVEGIGEPTYTDRPIALVTGRHHLQIFWYETGDTRVLGYLPIAWDTMDRRWFPTDANFIKPPEDESGHPELEVGTWNYGCIACHVTDERPRWRGPPSTATEASEFGIACEACHGPSRVHAEAMRSPDDRYAQHLAADAATDVVNPAKLGADLGSQVCGRCHSVWRHQSNESYQQFLADGMPFRPGMRLEDGGVHVVRGHAHDPSSFWPDDEVKPSGREYNGVTDSPCFEGGDFGCSSCHTLHARGWGEDYGAWRDDQLHPRMRGNAGCTQCHEDLASRAQLTAHSNHPPGSAGSECMNCHMPFTNLGLRKAIRSHTISSPSVEVDRATGRPNACNGCHLDRPLGWTASVLSEWYDHPVPPDLTDVERAVPAVVVDLLSGDAAERALAASALGWTPAVRISRARQWAPAMLATLLADPYDAVRYHAKRSLHRIPGFSEDEVDYDWVGPADQRRAQARAVADRWAERRRARGRTTDLRTLLVPAAAGGADLGLDVFRTLAASRDDTPTRVDE